MTYLGPGSTGLEITTASVAIDPALASADPAMMATAARAFASAAHQIQGAGQASSKASAQLSADWSGKGKDGFDAASSKLNARTALGADAIAGASAALQTLAAQIAAAKAMAHKAQTMAADSSQAATALQSSYAAASQQAVQALPADATYEQALAARAPSAAQVAQADTISGDAAQATRLMAQANTMARQAWDQAAVAFRAITATSPTRTAHTSGHAHQRVKVSPDQVRIVTQPDGRRVYSFDGGLAIPLDLPGAHQFVEEIKAYMPRFLAGDHAGLQVPPNLSAQGLWFVAASFWVTTSMQTIPEALRNAFFTARFSSVTMKQLAIMSLPEIVGGAYALSQSEFFKNLFSRQVATSAGNVPLNEPARTDPPTGNTTPTTATANQVTDAQTVQADQQLGTDDTNAGNTDIAGSSVGAGGAAEKMDKLAEMAAAARETLRAGSSRNVAVATYEINGVGGNLRAVSGQADRPGAVGAPSDPTFTPVRGRFVRPYDAEYKILEQIATQASPDSTGTVNLYSELPPCPACTSVIEQFRKAFPGIAVHVSTGG